MSLRYTRRRRRYATDPHRRRAVQRVLSAPSATCAAGGDEPEPEAGRTACLAPSGPGRGGHGRTIASNNPPRPAGTTWCHYDPVVASVVTASTACPSRRRRSPGRGSETHGDDGSGQGRGTNEPVVALSRLSR